MEDQKELLRKAKEEGIRLAEINDSSQGTWLEPYIGYKVEVIKTSKYMLWFKWDAGMERHEKINFTLL